jgi:Na+/proline symporter
MNFDLSQVALIGLGYLLLLFGIAYITERGWIPDSITSHPITYILSLGIFASAWAFYGVVDLAFQYGYGALAYYLGTGALFYLHRLRWHLWQNWRGDIKSILLLIY